MYGDRRGSGKKPVVLAGLGSHLQQGQGDGMDGRKEILAETGAKENPEGKEIKSRKVQFVNVGVRRCASAWRALRSP